MHGITLTSAPSDWEILQHTDGYATIALKGHYNVHPAALEVGVEWAKPNVRVMREDNNETVIPWIPVGEVTAGENFTGTFDTKIKIPAGGLYRIETCLETKSILPDITWLYRGDCVLHLGVGNVFIIAGQSNAGGYGRDYAADPPHMCVHLFRNRSSWDLATHPMNESTAAGSIANEEMGIPGVSPWLAFGKKYFEMTGMPVGFIQTAKGGTSIKLWKPGEGELYLNLLDKIARTGGKYAGVLWYQGCDDANPENAPHYLAWFREFAESLREALGYEIPFFTCQLNRFVGGMNDECWGLVREAQRLAALTIPGVTVMPATNLSISDSVHNSAHGNIMLGERLARQCHYHLNGGEEFAAPELERAELAEENLLCLTFCRVRLGFQLFTNIGSESGFTLEDAEGKIPVKFVRYNRQDMNKIYLEIERKPAAEVLISFAWEADPVRMPMLDEVTYLPPLSFFKRKFDIQ